MSNNRKRRDGSLRSQQSQTNDGFREISQLRFNWIRRIEALALNRIKWSNLPDTVDERFIEKTLLYWGSMVWYEATDGVILCTKFSNHGQLDLYDNPTQVASVGNNGHYFLIPKGEEILMYDSRTRTAFGASMNDQVNKLAELEQTRLMNRRQQRWAKIVTAPAEAQADLIRLRRDLDQGQAIIYGIDGMQDNISVSSVDASNDYMQSEFQEDTQNSFNALLSQLGIKNQSYEKTQYQHLEEVMMTNDEISRVREDLLNERRLAAKKVNERFGLDIKVDWNNDSYEIIQGEPSVETRSDEDESE